MQISVGRILSAVVAGGQAAALTIHQGGITRHGFGFCVLLLLALALIWFSEELGSFTGYLGRGRTIDAPTPPPLIAIVGWFFLLVAMPIMLYGMWNLRPWW